MAAIRKSLAVSVRRRPDRSDVFYFGLHLLLYVLHYKVYNASKRCNDCGDHKTVVDTCFYGRAVNNLVLLFGFIFGCNGGLLSHLAVKFCVLVHLIDPVFSLNLDQGNLIGISF